MPNRPIKSSVEYILGKGHVKFFYDKGLYLQKRHADRVREMKLRGYQANFSLDLSGWSKEYMNDWTPTEKDMQINRARILERLTGK